MSATGRTPRGIAELEDLAAVFGALAHHTRRIIHLRDGLITTDEPVSDANFNRAEQSAPAGAAA